MRIIIHCDDCGHSQQIERKFVEAQVIHAICHSCELPLRAILTPEAIEAYQIASLARMKGPQAIMARQRAFLSQFTEKINA